MPGSVSGIFLFELGTGVRFGLPDIPAPIPRAGGGFRSDVAAVLLGEGILEQQIERKAYFLCVSYVLYVP
jgi:hypothetical protein